MSGIQGKNTKPEVLVRKALTLKGYRYRLHRNDLPGRPDIVMPGRRVAIFVHGCFWHGHDCPHGARVPKANRDYWLAKVSRNRDRDIASTAALAEAGWRVETIWECQLKPAEDLTARLGSILTQRTLHSRA